MLLCNVWFKVDDGANYVDEVFCEACKNREVLREEEEDDEDTEEEPEAEL
jgi:hypothetical protein